MCPEMCALETDWSSEYYEVYPFGALYIICAIDAQATWCIQAWFPHFVLDLKFSAEK